MIFNIPQLISFLSQSTTLLPGTLIMTGTPPGPGHFQTPPRYLQPGDELCLEISGLGQLRQEVVSSSDGRSRLALG
uniref:5-carboxymethyl-2-hydroxymuconate isomerase n=1 Tax=Tetraselmis sp. GSL018 TaxID=582737 RepID=A0A061S4P5_9CHLO